MQIGQLGELHAAAGQVDGHHGGDGRGVRCHDEEAASGPTAHLGDLMMFEQPYRLPEQGTTDVLTLNQLGFGPDQIPRLQSAPPR